MMRSLPRGSAIAFTLVLATTVLAPTAQAQPDLGREAAQPTLGSNLDGMLDDAAADVLWDVDELRRLVATEIAFEDYDGILKGARGALLSGRANAIDQALLLGALLDRALIPYRFATCTLAADVPGSQAAQDPGAEVAAANGDDDLAERLTQLAAETVDPELRAAVMEIVELWRAQQAATARASESLATELADVPFEAGANASPGSDPGRRHVWVQSAFGADWRDLDTTTADGTAACEPTEVFDTLPEGWAHQVTVAVEVEQRRAGGLETSDALVFQVPAHELASARMAATFGEAVGLVDEGTLSPTGLKRYTPVLLVDGRLVTGRPLELPPSSGSSLGIGDATTDALEELTDELLDDDPTTADDGALEPDPYTGAWIRVDLTAPDGKVRTTRSEIFDRIGIAARQSDAVADGDVAPLTDVAGEWAETSALWQVGILFGELTVPDAAFDDSLAIDTVSGVSGHLDSLLRMYPAIYRTLGGRPDGPMVLVAGVGQVAGEEAPVAHLLLDALHVPASATSDRLAAARDAQALLGAEALLMALLEGGVASARDSLSVLRREAPLSLMTIAPGDLEALPASLSPEARARMAGHLEAGHWLVAPEQPPADGTAWWYVDPLTGLVRDEHENGRHSAAVEETGLTARILRAKDTLCRYGRTVGLRVYVAAKIIAIAASPTSVPVVDFANLEAQRRRDQAAQIACAGSGGAGPG